MNLRIILLISVVFFFSIVYVSAETGQIQSGDIEMECIYDNGGLLSAYYSGGAYAMHATNFNLSNKLEIPGGISSGTAVFYDETNFAKEILDSATCPNEIYFGILRQYDKEGLSSVAFPMYITSKNLDKVNCSTIEYWYNDDNDNGKHDDGEKILYRYCKTPKSKNFDANFFTKKVVSGFEPYRGYFDPLEIQSGTAISKRIIANFTNMGATIFKFNLVNERVYFVNDVEPIERRAYKSDGTQATSKTSYARLYKYMTTNGSNKYFLEKDQVMTTLSISLPKETHENNINYLCLKEPSKIMDSNKNNMGYTFSDIRYKGNIITRKKDETNVKCTSDRFNLYKEVDWDEMESNEDDATSICDIIPNTALVLADIINIVRMVVPAFLIILTGIDISRIVIAGNIDEELPKKRKNIIIRFIVVAVFFFLPLLVQTIVASSYGVDFGDVSCIWN